MQSNYGGHLRSPKVDVHDFAMVPRADIPRSSFRMQHQHKTTFSAVNLIPVYVQEILPGDSFSLRMTAFVRMATPIYPIMDNLDLESWFFFVPNRLTWSHWVNFMGEQVNPADSISYSIPQIVSPATGFVLGSIYDYMGLPGPGQITGVNTISINALPLRAYNLIFNQWFRDENLQNSRPINTGDGPDTYTDYVVMGVNRRHDYFSSALPWTQKGNTAITLPLGTTALVKTQASEYIATSPAVKFRSITGGSLPAPNLALGLRTNGELSYGSTTVTGLAAGNDNYPSNLYADLSTATAATINQIRLAFQTQRLLERDARGGTRYTEIIRSHFGVVSPDARLQRPEYLGGGKTPITINPVPQTSGTAATGTTTPLGTLAAAGTAISSNNGFRQSFTEHGYIIGLVAIRGDSGYQQGIRKMWKRLTRYDFYMPVFSMLGEQSILNYEIYADGSANDALTFGYQERWAEYRYFPSFTSGYFRSTATTPLDAWHLMQKFTALPTLNASFIIEPIDGPIQRSQAVGALGINQQFLCDIFFDCKAARPMPMYSVPGMIDHF